MRARAKNFSGNFDAFCLQLSPAFSTSFARTANRIPGDFGRVRINGRSQKLRQPAKLKIALVLARVDGRTLTAACSSSRKILINGIHCNRGPLPSRLHLPSCILRARSLARSRSFRVGTPFRNRRGSCRETSTGRYGTGKCRVIESNGPAGIPLPPSLPPLHYVRR